MVLGQGEPDTGLLLINEHGRQDDPLAEGPHRAALELRSSGHVVAERVHDDVGGTV